MTEQAPRAQQEYDLGIPGWPILERPENTLDHNGNEVDVVALKDRFRGGLMTPEYNYALDVASAVAYETAREIARQAEEDDVDYSSSPLHRNDRTPEGLAHTAAHLSAHYFSFIQWVASLPGEQWPKDCSQPEFITWAEELNANLEAAKSQGETNA